MTPPERNTPLIAMIDQFLANPFDIALGQALMDSGDARHETTMVLSAAVMPWTCYSDTADLVRVLDAVLSMAYVAGNMREQLALDRNANAPGAGLAAVTRVYGVLRTRFPEYHVPEVTLWQQALDQRRLPGLADSLSRVRDECSGERRRY